MILPIVSQLSASAQAELEEFIETKIAEALQAAREERRWLTVSETADYLGVSEVAVRRRISRGRIPVRRQGRSVLVDREALDRQIENGT